MRGVSFLHAPINTRAQPPPANHIPPHPARSGPNTPGGTPLPPVRAASLARHAACTIPCTSDQAADRRPPTLSPKEFIMLRLSLLASFVAAFMLAALSPITPTADAGSHSAVTMKRAKKDEVRFRAIARGREGKAKGDYRERSRRGDTVRRIQVQIERATPGAEYPVLLNGTQIGTIVVNDFGRGKFARQTVTDDPGKQGDVPQVHAGDTLTVGPLSGSFRPKN